MAVLLAIALCAALLCAVFGVEIVLFAWFVSGEPPRLLRPLVAWLVARPVLRRRRVSQPLPPVLLGLELRRLGGEIIRVEEGNQPAKASRLTACSWAYDHVLIEYCRSLDIPVPSERSPLTARQRFDAEAALLGAGHEW
jgi:hypothetical protein